MNPLLSVKGSLITGFVIAILFAVFAVDGGWNELGLARRQARDPQGHREDHRADDDEGAHRAQARPRF